MVKAYLKLVGIQIATGVVLSLISGIAVWIISMFGGMVGASPGAHGTMIISGIVSVVGSFFVAAVIRQWIIPTYVSQSEVNYGDGYFARHIRDKNFLTNKPFVLMFVPSTLLGLVAVLLTFYYGWVVYAPEDFFILVPFVAFSIMLLITGIGGMFVKADYSQCPKCKSMYSFIYDGTSDRINESYIESKTEDVTETVGEVKGSNGEHIADVTHTYKQQYNREVNVASWEVYKHCAKCGRKMTESHSEKTKGQWR